jgi:hypothetical protein
MAQPKQQLCSYSPKLTIDCILANVGTQLEADGCVLELSETSSRHITPDQLTPGQFVKVRLWLEGDGTCIDIRLAEVRRIHKHWVSVEMIQVSPNDRMRLKRFVEARAAMPQEQPALINRLLIRV